MIPAVARVPDLPAATGRGVTGTEWALRLPGGLDRAVPGRVKCSMHSWAATSVGSRFAVAFTHSLEQFRAAVCGDGPAGAPRSSTDIQSTGATAHMTSSIEATSSVNKVAVDDIGSEEAFLA